MKTFTYTPISEERFKEIMKLQEMLLHDKVTIEEFCKLVSDEDMCNFRHQAQLKMVAEIESDNRSKTALS